ncbi:MAG: hypothetical protein C0407_02525 [Desulfobacca sp.]|nr:hypothetical protein [Desulfobacca sp.]
MDFLPLRQMEHLALSGGSILFFGEAMARLSAYLISQLSLQGKSIILLDATQAFDPYLVARAGRHAGTPARPLLERIRLSRAFTCHQIVTLICDILPRQKVREPLFVLGPCVLFYDEQVPLKERQALFQQVVRSLIILNQRGPGCFLFQGPIARRAKNQHFGKELSKSVQWVIRVDSGEQGLEGKLLKTEFEGQKSY